MKTRNCISTLVLAGLLLAFVAQSCRKDSLFATEESARVEFSCDTLAFDTVFTTMGTVTKQLKIYNPLDEGVRIHSITLRNGRQSRFRLNVDGDTSMVVRDIELRGGDSLFVFVQANISPNSDLEPFIVEDAVVVDLGRNVQNVVLTAWGRNAVYHVADPVRGYCVIDCDHWDHSRPHVIVGTAAVDSACTLTLTAGDELYFSNTGVLYIYREGTLKVEGSRESPVLFTSLRHDGWYDTLPGQWGYLLFDDGSVDNVIDYAVIENGMVGLFADKGSRLKVTNTVVRGMSLAGILGQGSHIRGDNLLVHTCKTATAALQHGGNYEFRNSTFADYWKYDTRAGASVVLNNIWQEEQGGPYLTAPLEKADFYNCIIYGSNSEENGGELYVDCSPDAGFHSRIENCVVRLSGCPGVDTVRISTEDPRFVDKICDYHLSEDSPAIGWGSSAWVTIPDDLDGRPRSNPSSAGCYERFR